MHRRAPSILLLLLSTLLLLLSGTQAAMARSLDAQLPNLGEPINRVMTPAEEQQIGAEVFAKLRQQEQFINDPLLLRYLNDLGARLMSAASGTRFPPHFVLIDSPTINAFTVPGGHIAVYSGLMLAADNESELAGVLAHEIAHATHRHIAQMIAAQSGNNAAAIAGFIAALLLGAVDPQAGAAAATLGVAGAAQNQLNFTRMHEREADRFAIQTLVRSHINPDGLVSFFQKLQRQSGSEPGTQLEYLRTHPLNSERISAAEDRIAQIPSSQLGETDSRTFELARARLAALTGQSGLDYPDSESRHYAAAITTLKEGHLNRAHRLLQTLEQRHPDSLWIGLPLARVRYQLGETQAATDKLHQLESLYPDNDILLRQSVQWKIAQGSATQALAQAQQAYERHPDDPQKALTAAEAAAAAGKPLRNHELLGHYFELRGRLVEAHQEYETAFTYSAQDPLAQQRLNAALEHIEQQVKGDKDSGN